MKKKCWAAALASAVMCFQSVVDMSAATQYDPCDVNLDGAVSIVDVVFISRYVGGLATVADVSQLDADQNLIVNELDARCVLAKLVGNMYSVEYI